MFRLRDQPYDIITYDFKKDKKYRHDSRIPMTMEVRSEQRIVIGEGDRSISIQNEGEAIKLLVALNAFAREKGEEYVPPELEIKTGEDGIAQVGVLGYGRSGKPFYYGRVVGITRKEGFNTQNNGEEIKAFNRTVQQKMRENEKILSRQRWRGRMAKVIQYIPRKVRQARWYLTHKLLPWAAPVSVLGALGSDFFLGTNLAESAMETLQSGAEAAKDAVGLEHVETNKAVLGAAGLGYLTWKGVEAIERGFPDRVGSLGYSPLHRPSQPFFYHLTRPLIFGYGSHAHDLIDSALADSRRKFRAYGIPTVYLGLSDLVHGNGFLKNVGSLIGSGYDMINKATVDAPSVGHFLGEAGLYGGAVYLGGRMMTHAVRRFTSQSETQRSEDAEALAKIGRFGKRAGLGLLGVAGASGLGYLIDAAMTPEGQVPVTRQIVRDYPGTLDRFLQEGVDAGNDVLEKLKSGEFDTVFRLPEDPKNDNPMQARIRETIRADYGSLENFYEGLKGGLAEGRDNLLGLPSSCLNAAKDLAN